MGSTCSVVNDFSDGRHVVVGLTMEKVYLTMGLILGSLGLLGVGAGVGAAFAGVDDVVVITDADDIGADAVADDIGAADAADGAGGAAGGAGGAADGLLRIAGTAAWHSGLVPVEVVVQMERVLQAEFPNQPNNDLGSMSPEDKKNAIIMLMKAIMNKKPKDRSEDEKQVMKKSDEAVVKYLAHKLKMCLNNGKEGDPEHNRYSENYVDLAKGEKRRWPATLSLARTAHVFTINCENGVLEFERGTVDVWTGASNQSDNLYSSSKVVNLTKVPYSELKKCMS